MHFRHAIVAMADRDFSDLRAPIPHRVDRPALPLTKQRSDGYGEGILGFPRRHVHNDPIVMAEARPSLRGTREIDGRPNTLLLNS
jgi:hypothetical protein